VFVKKHKRGERTTPERCTRQRAERFESVFSLFRVFPYLG
jgi:hypothetical protein